MTIAEVAGGPRLADVRALFQEYADGLAIDLSFQGFDEEVAWLPGAYAAPDGTLLLCTIDEAAAGCVAVRRVDAGACEMKRLFVRPSCQGKGIGRELAGRAIAWARSAGYERMLLDTLPSMTSAQRMYEGLGFRDIPPYRFNPVAGTRFLMLPLHSATSQG